MALIATPVRHSAAGSLAALLVLSACAGPGPVTAPTTGAYSTPLPSASMAQPAGPGEYVAAPGDTVYTVAQRNGVGVRALIDENKLQPPYALQPGQHLRIPAQREHVVQAGETVYAIARRYQVPMAELVRINNIPQPYAIRVGQKLRLPDPVGEIETASAPTAVPQPSQPSVAQSAIQVTELPPPTGGSKPGTPYTAPGATAPVAPTATQLAAPPTIAKPANAPRAGAPTPLTPAASSAPIAVGQTPPPGVIPSSPPPAPVAPPPITPAPAAPAPTESAALIAPPAPAAPVTQGFIWPVKGELISRFGDKATGLRNDGINIAAPKGTPVVAADNGVVAYSGNELKGFGNLVLIRHPNGWVTAYAHNETLLVARGEHVERGQEIARVGSTGNVTSPQLHFEVRKGGERIDPLSVIGAESDPRKT
ncbi:MAG: peptidoglycan DD-metalloendopeptidase family protein [Alphaproteobacteria bacterium]